MNIPEGYKQTEVGTIPDDWKIKRLKSVIQLKNGFAFKSDYFSENGSIILTPGNFKLEGGLYFNEKNTKRYSGNFPSEFKFNYGDLVIVMTDLTKECNLLGKPAFVNHPEEILHNQRIGKVEILNNEVCKKFLFYFFLSNKYHLKIKETATGSTVRHTSPTSIYEISIPLPPTISEQKAITQSLSDVDALITECDLLITKKLNTKQGTMQQLLTGEKRLPGFSGEWKVEKLRDLTTLMTNGFVGKATTHYTKSNDGVLYIQGFNVIENSFNFTGIKRVTLDFHLCNSKSCLKVGDLLTIQTGDIGVTTIVPKELEGSNCHALIITRFKKEKVSPQFFCQYFNSIYGRAKFKNIEIGTTMKHLNVGDFIELQLLIPPTKEEQKEIAQILSNMDTEIAALEQKRDKYKAIKQGMMQELLTGKTRLIGSY
ncbi:MAG: restriction endonuclease subunit S [Nostoc sp.]|uniref:restriction endonuclease subunit S n=1 Tax=Nostoc sp. TaxID=1180 RepID=UPI002FF6AEF2